MAALSSSQLVLLICNGFTVMAMSSIVTRLDANDGVVPYQNLLLSVDTWFLCVWYRVVNLIACRKRC